MNETEFDPFIDSIARELKAPVRFDPHFDARVMAAIEAPVISIDSRRGVTPWYRRRISVSVSGLAAAAAFAGITVFGAVELTRMGGGEGEVAEPTTLMRVADVEVDPATQVQQVQFLLVAPDAKSVSLVGQFNSWDEAATPMRFDAAQGAWEVSVPLTPGVYQYQFVVDGTKRVTDPAAPEISSDFGSPNSLKTVRAQE